MESKTGWGYSIAEATQERHACISICPQRNMKTIFDERYNENHIPEHNYCFGVYNLKATKDKSAVEKVVYAIGDEGDDNIISYEPDRKTTPTGTFIGTQDGWRNNHRVVRRSGLADLSGSIAAANTTRSASMWSCLLFNRSDA